MSLLPFPPARARWIRAINKVRLQFQEVGLLSLQVLLCLAGRPVLVIQIPSWKVLLLDPQLGMRFVARQAPHGEYLAENSLLSAWY